MVPENLLYTRDHEWARIDGDTATVGITDHAQEALGDITFIELPKISQSLAVHGFLGSVESSKAASDIYSPVAGSVTEINKVLTVQPDLINKDCYGAGWLCRVKLTDPDPSKNLLSPAQYQQFLESNA